ncbi:BTAD domain-containing putative transcriptional regulator, partial [Streptomyces lonarensis]
MRFQLLGPLSICDTSDTVVLQPSKPTNLLAALLLHSNTVVSADFLQRMVWGDEQPATAKAALQTCVLRLRRLFQRHGVTDTSIEAVPGGYRITADPRTLDLLEFRAYVTAADHGGDAEEQLRSLRSALALWQGSVLANVRSEPVQRDLVPQLSEERLHVVERVCDLELALGRCSMVLGDLWGATRAHPDHGRFREQLIEALYRTGRQAEALAEYRRVKQYLSDELGVDPSPALQQLELAILRGEDLGPTTGPGTRPAVRGEVVRLPLPAAEAPTPGDGVRRVVTASGAAGGEPAAVAEHPAAVPARPAGPERAAVAGPAAAEGRLRAAEDAPRGPGGTPAGAVGLRLATEPPAGADPGVPRARRAGDDADHQSIDQRTADQRTADHHAADHRVADHHPADRPAAPDRPAERRAGADAPTGRHTGAVAGAHHTAPRH